MTRPHVESRTVLDIRQLSRGMADRSKAEAVRLTFTAADGQPVQRRIDVIKRTRGQLAGVRLFYACPACRRACELVYVYRGTEIACRKCLRLAYSSENMTKVQRRVHKLVKLRRRLGQDGEICTLGPHPEKPAWMRWATYDTAIAQIENIELVLFNAVRPVRLQRYVKPIEWAR